MKYLLMIYLNEENQAAVQGAEARREMNAEYSAFTESIKKAGNYLAGEALQPVATATTVRIRDGKRLTTDGPFAETREHLGGFYLVDARDIDEAIAMASRIPAARTGSVEVRPVVDFAPPRS